MTQMIDDNRNKELDFDAQLEKHARKRDALQPIQNMHAASSNENHTMSTAERSVTQMIDDNRNKELDFDAQLEKHARKRDALQPIQNMHAASSNENHTMSTAERSVTQMIDDNRNKELDFDAQLEKHARKRDALQPIQNMHAASSNENHTMSTAERSVTQMIDDNRNKELDFDAQLEKKPSFYIECGVMAPSSNGMVRR